VLGTQTKEKAAVTKEPVVVRRRKPADNESTNMSIPCMRLKTAHPVTAPSAPWARLARLFPTRRES